MCQRHGRSLCFLTKVAIVSPYHFTISSKYSQQNDLNLSLKKPLTVAHYSVKPPFHSCCSLSVTNRPWHSSPPCLHFFLHLSCATKVCSFILTDLSLLMHSSPLSHCLHCMPCTTLTCLPLSTSSCSITVPLLAPCPMLSLDPQRHSEAPSNLLCTSPSAPSKQTSHLFCSPIVTSLLSLATKTLPISSFYGLLALLQMQTSI